MTTLHGKIIFITGSTRGIGREIALRAAKDGAHVVITGKTVDPHAQLEGTIHTVAEEVRQAGGQALAIQMDIRFEDQIQQAVDQAVSHFGGLDILVNNTSAISLTGTLDTPAKKFDLMMGCNARGTFLTSQACIPHLKKASNPHILTLSPPLNMKAKWFKRHCAYTMAKYGMSLCTLGMSEEFRADGIAVNSLWPRTAIATAAVRMFGGEALIPGCRTPAILADTAHIILTRPARDYTGHFFVDDEVLASAGITDLSAYAVQPGAPLVPDFFLD